MSKPILVVKFPQSYPPQVGEEIGNKLNSNVELSNDYFLFTIPNDKETFEFKVFNGEYEESEYTKLEELIEELKK